MSNGFLSVLFLASSIARLMAVSNGGRPVWFRTDQDMGHFNTAQGAQAREQADTFSFAELMSAK